MERRFSAIIVNYNGERLLEECLPSIFEACNSSGLDFEMIVVDNASTDGSVDFLRQNYPSIKILSEDKNKYWFSVNDGIRTARYDYLLLLNNDVKVDKRCIPHLMKHFDEEDVFAVMPKEILWDMKALGLGATGLKFKHGLIAPSETYHHSESCITFYAASIVMYDKRKLLQTGLFDDLFYPFFYEDVDLSYRAWKMGFRIIHESNAIIYHKSGGTIDKFFKKDAKRIYAYKNGLLFMWKNVTDIKLLAIHLMYLILFLSKSLLLGPKDLPKGFLLAMSSFGKMLSSRKEATKKFVISDREIFKKLRKER